MRDPSAKCGQSSKDQTGKKAKGGSSVLCEFRSRTRQGQFPAATRRREEKSLSLKCTHGNC